MDAGGIAGLLCALTGWKNLVIGFCKKGVIPLMFQLKIRIMSASGVLRGGCVGMVARGGVMADVLRLVDGGGLMSRVMMSVMEMGDSIDRDSVCHGSRVCCGDVIPLLTIFLSHQRYGQFS